MIDLQLDPEGRRFWTLPERRRQIAELEQLSGEMAALLTADGDAWQASHFAAKAEHARELLEPGFDQPDLNELGGAFPTLDWLNPKARDNGLPQPAGWGDTFIRLHDAAVIVARDLRSVATP